MSGISCFMAYSSDKYNIEETLESAKEAINKNGILNITSWKDLNITGAIIIDKILEKIEESQLFICDLSSLNANVLFELGYAIARKKKIWILLNESYVDSISEFIKFNLLTIVGYTTYCNSTDITTKLYEEQPYENLEGGININKKTDKDKILLYIKSNIPTEPSIHVDTIVQRGPFKNIIDDPVEGNNSLNWYLTSVSSSTIVLTHFLAENHANNISHNAKCAFISGLAHGFQKPLLMLAHQPFNPPLDYRSILKSHKTKDQAVQIAHDFINTEYSRIVQEEANYNNYKENIKHADQLQNVNLGEFVAENEERELSNYYIKTAAYTHAFRSDRTLFVGRKGTGKSANLIYLTQTFSADKKVVVCKIQPVSYELEGIIRMLTLAIPISEQGFLVESLWEYLIYSEISKTVFNALASRPTYISPNDDELNFINYVNQNQNIIMNDFSIRLENVVKQITELKELETNTAEQTRIKLSEKLHATVLRNVRRLLGAILKDKKKVVVLIDNLDKAWDGKKDISKLSLLITGLLSVSEKVVLDFQKNNNNKVPINFSLLIFLRNDIFNEILNLVKEKDKIPFTQILWNDRDLLIRVLEERFINSIENIMPENIWENYFCKKVKGIITKDYILNSILPKPRDLLFLAKAAQDIAINRKHSKIEEEDIIEAEKQYSKHALDTIVTEGTSKCNQIEEFLYEFVSHSEIITIDEIENAIMQTNIKEDINVIIDLLLDLLFMGIECRENEFTYIYDAKDKNKYSTMERKLLESTPNKIRRFKINKAFHAYLEVTSERQGMN